MTTTVITAKSPSTIATILRTELFDSRFAGANVAGADTAATVSVVAQGVPHIVQNFVSAGREEPHPAQNLCETASDGEVLTGAPQFGQKRWAPSSAHPHFSQAFGIGMLRMLAES